MQGTTALVIDATIVVQICSTVCEAIATTQRQHPEHLAEKYQSFSWQRTPYQLTFREKLAARLGKISRPDVFLREIEHILRSLFTPLFFESSDYQHLILQIETLLSPSSQTQENLTPLEPQITSSNNQKIHNETAIAILLLDAENLQPDTATEQFLEKNCTYPLQIKIAFANWKKLGNYDVELHRRGYDMIHVPAGNDMADGKMIAFGSSIHEHYPSAKEIVICSSDKVMSNLCNRLRQRGLIVYQVRKQDDEIVMINPANGQVTPYLPKITVKIPPIEECVIQLKDLLRAEQKRSCNSWVKLSKISQIFQTKNGFTISRMMTEYSPGKRARDLFVDRPKEFVTHQFSEKEELYITVFELPEGEPESLSKQTNQSQKSQIEKALKISNSQELQNALTNLAKEFIAGSPEKFVDIGILGSQFHKRYGQPITTTLKTLNINKKFPTFLQACPELQVQQKEKGWQVTIRS